MVRLSAGEIALRNACWLTRIGLVTTLRPDTLTESVNVKISIDTRPRIKPDELIATLGAMIDVLSMAQASLLQPAARPSVMEQLPFTRHKTRGLDLPEPTTGYWLYAESEVGEYPGFKTFKNTSSGDDAFTWFRTEVIRVVRFTYENPTELTSAVPRASQIASILQNFFLLGPQRKAMAADARTKELESIAREALLDQTVVAEFDRLEESRVRLSILEEQLKQEKMKTERRRRRLAESKRKAEHQETIDRLIVAMFQSREEGADILLGRKQIEALLANINIADSVKLLESSSSGVRIELEPSSE